MDILYSVQRYRKRLVSVIVHEIQIEGVPVLEPEE
jgi:hypothetical protein